MTNPLRAGAVGEPLPGDEIVLRLLKFTTLDGEVSPKDFTLSSEDELAPLQSLSVWARALTTPLQAVSFFPEEKRAAYKHYTLLSVDNIRALRPEPNSPNVPSLDVVWDPRVDEQSGLPDQQPGAEGHCGVTGLVKVANLASAKIYSKSLRDQLVVLASAALTQMPELK